MWAGRAGEAGSVVYVWKETGCAELIAGYDTTVSPQVRNKADWLPS